MTFCTESIAAHSGSMPTRRGVIGGLVSGAAMLALSNPALAAVLHSPVRRIKLHHALTGEHTWVTYFIEGQYVDEAFTDIEYLLRDHRRSKKGKISRDLVDLMSSVQKLLDTPEPIMVTSGFRTAKTNAMLKRTGHEPARNSLHMKGMAADFFIESRSVKQVAAAARALKMGGVGEYGDSSFVHLDVGRVRYWTKA